MSGDQPSTRPASAVESTTSGRYCTTIAHSPSGWSTISTASALPVRAGDGPSGHAVRARAEHQLAVGADGWSIRLADRDRHLRHGGDARAALKLHAHELRRNGVPERPGGDVVAHAFDAGPVSSFARAAGLRRAAFFARARERDEQRRRQRADQALDALAAPLSSSPPTRAPVAEGSRSSRIVARSTPWSAASWRSRAFWVAESVTQRLTVR
jgi:hypothetical protein